MPRHTIRWYGDAATARKARSAACSRQAFSYLNWLKRQTLPANERPTGRNRQICSGERGIGWPPKDLVNHKLLISAFHPHCPVPGAKSAHIWPIGKG